ncbi:MAG: DUF6519 domain-containing protein [Allosphingosinicella sp.]
MRGDFSRDTRERARRASTRAVLLQQGRQLLDADWNEQAGLVADREEQLARHAIGRQGAPRDDAGFAITPAAGDLNIGAGSLYAEGLLLANPAARTYASQLPTTMLPALATIIPDGQEGFVYVEALLRPASLTADPSLAEPALAGADTVVRETVAWTVRAVPLASVGMARAPLIQALDRNQPVTLAPWAVTTGGLDADVATEAEVTDPGPCEMPPSAGYLDQLNRLYRVEIHAAGPAGGGGAATFKWTEDAGREAGLRAQGAGFAIDLPIARATEWFPAGSVAEVIDDARMRAGLPGEIGTISSAPGAILQITGVPGSSLSTNVRIRRWAALPAPVPATGAWIQLAKGIKIRFATGNYVSGSAWTIPGRTLTGDIIWPPYPGADFNQTIAAVSVPFYRPTEGRRRYAALALVRRNGANFTVTQDLRDLFPPLTDITAGDVRFNDSPSNLGAANVQQAIDALAARESTCCTIEVRPGAGWQSALTAIPAGRHATICFAPGNYRLEAPLELRNLGHVRLRGAGLGTKIWCYGDTCALRFLDCASVEMTDMLVAAERRAPPPALPASQRQTRGAVEARDCGPVRAQRVTFIAAGTRWRQAACLRIEAPAGGNAEGGGTVVIEDCDIVPGDLASGILILNGTNVRICGNRIRPRGESAARTYRRWADDPVISAALGRTLLSYATPTARGSRPPTRLDTRLFKDRTQSYAGAGSIFYYGSAFVADADWTSFHSKHAAAFSGNSRLVRLDLRRIVSNLWTKGGGVTLGNQNFTGFQAVVGIVQQTLAPIIDTAITVAGGTADKVTISGNAIEGAIDGIRVAISSGVPGNRVRADTVRIADNHIRLRAALVDLVRHGIYVGNVERCWITDNDVAYETADSRNDGPRLTRVRANNIQKLHAEGIRVFGSLGRVVQLRGNSVESCPTAYTVRAFAGSVDGRRQWLVQGNLADDFRKDFDLHQSCKRTDNQPTP